MCEVKHSYKKSTKTKETSIVRSRQARIRSVIWFLKWALEPLISALRVEMQPNLFPFGTVLGNPFLFNGDLSSEGFESSRVFFLVPFLLSQGGGMDLSKVGEKILSSVRSARSLGLLPSTSDRPEVIIFLYRIRVMCLIIYRNYYYFS